MDSTVKRITAVSRTGDETKVVVIYRDEKSKRKGSKLSAPLETVVRRMLRAEAVGSAKALELHEKSNNDRRDGWLRDAPENFIKSSRKAYNEARKAVPFRLLPKA